MTRDARPDPLDVAVGAGFAALALAEAPLPPLPQNAPADDDPAEPVTETPRRASSPTAAAILFLAWLVLPVGLWASPTRDGRRPSPRYERASVASAHEAGAVEEVEEVEETRAPAQRAAEKQGLRVRSPALTPGSCRRVTAELSRPGKARGDGDAATLVRATVMETILEPTSRGLSRRRILVERWRGEAGAKLDEGASWDVVLGPAGPAVFDGQGRIATPEQAEALGAAYASFGAWLAPAQVPAGVYAADTPEPVGDELAEALLGAAAPGEALSRKARGSLRLGAEDAKPAAFALRLELHEGDSDDRRTRTKVTGDVEATPKTGLIRAARLDLTRVAVTAAGSSARRRRIELTAEPCKAGSAESAAGERAELPLSRQRAQRGDDLVRRKRRKGSSKKPPKRLKPGKLVRYASGGAELSAVLTAPWSDKRPAVVFVHDGAALKKGAWKRLKAVRAAGLVTLAPTFRGEHGNPGAFELLGGEAQDVAAAVRWLSNHPRVDRTRISLVGVGAGGTLALLAAQLGAPVASVTTIHAPLELSPILAKLKGKPPFDAKDARSRRLRSPIHHLDSLTVPATLRIDPDDPRQRALARQARRIAALYGVDVAVDASSPDVKTALTASIASWMSDSSMTGP